MKPTSPLASSVRGLFLLLAAGLLPTAALAAAKQPPPSDNLPTVAVKTAGMERRDGLLTFYLDRREGKLWLALPAVPAEGAAGEDALPGEVGRYLYAEALAGGLGSNPVNLDRGQLGDTVVVSLRRLGGRLLVEQLNTRYRAETEDFLERRAVRESFATSVLWAGEIAAEDADGGFLVDFTSFLVRDAHHVVARLQASEQGAYALDAARSAVDFTNCLAFPDNLELEALLTYAAKDPGAQPGEHVRQTAPAPEAISLVQHHSLIRLPDSGFKPRAFDPRAGSFDVRFLDYGAALDEPVERRWIARHRLQKPVTEPIVFYLDPGTPEPVRSALLEGASWWAAAFEAAGFANAYEVRLLPPDVHPLDVRYNVIQWVHRSTRGWSYGGGVIDPRTGEILKGHVNLGSLRVRQDRLLFEGLLGTAKTGTGAPDDPLQLALARLRQLAAHEVGHALGLNHNFAASSYGRASVMDYPAPLVKVTAEGELDLSEAYGVGVGAWDVLAIRWAYTEFPEGVDEDAALEAILQEGLDQGLIFLADQDARPPGAAHPLASLWDNGADPVAALSESLEVRRIGLERFGEDRIAPGQPLALLEEVLAPVYFHHRYQMDAAVKVVGGLEYRYGLRGDGQPPARPVAPERQRQALAEVLRLLDPAVLDLPEPLLGLLLPRPATYDPNPEMFRGATAPAFDPLSAAAAAADQAVRGLLQRERAARLVDFHRRDADLPGLAEVLRQLLDRSFAEAPEADSALARRHAGIRRTVQWVVARALFDLASDPAATPTVRAQAEGALAEIERRVAPIETAASPEDLLAPATAHRRGLAAAIHRFLERRDAPLPAPAPPPEPPPGSPIGTVGGSLSSRGCSLF